MKPGQVSKRWFCSFCGEPAVATRASALNDPVWRGYWATPCPCCVPVAWMGPKVRAAVVERYERRKQARREYIASCLGEPIE